jgi:charged multivesicular body protein 2A
MFDFVATLFKKKSPSEILRENKRQIDKHLRELDRERSQLQQQEKKLTIEIKRMAKENQLKSVRVLAKDLVRTRNSITKFYALKSQLQGVSLRMQTLKSTQAMADAMNGVTKAMGAMNKKLNLPAISKIMKEFERENDKMEMTTEIMGDALDDAFENEGEEDESEELVNAVLDELGCSMNADLVSVPIGGNKGSNGAIAANKSAAAAVEENSREKEPVLEGGGGVSGGIDDDLQARLDNLRK